MQSSTLLTVSVPSFDDETGQLSTTSHHLISTPLTYVNSLSDESETTLYFSQPPVKPYQTSDHADEDGEEYDTSHLDTDDEGEIITAGTNKKRKAPVEKGKGKKNQKVSSVDMTPADFASAREKEDAKSTTDKESELHHKSIEPMLTSAIEAVRSAWMAREEFKSSLKKDDPMNERWCGSLVGMKKSRSVNEPKPYQMVMWRNKKEEKEDAEEIEVPFVEIGHSEEVKEATEHHGGELDLFNVPMDEAEHYLKDFYGKIFLSNEPETFYLPFLPEESIPYVMDILTPPNSGWLMSDFSTWSDPSLGIAEVGKKRGGFNLVVIDPPWPNKSVNRSSSYETFDPYSLGKLDLPALLGNKASLVAVWVTNKVKYRKLIIDQLFPAWGIRGKAAEWYWVKITSGDKKNVGGEPVWNMDQSHRRCYEGLILGYYNPQSIPLPTLPLSKVFLAVPIGHSRKPNLSELLRPYLPVLSTTYAPNVLELFARNVFTGLKKEEILEKKKEKVDKEGDEDEEEEEEKSEGEGDNDEQEDEDGEEEEEWRGFGNRDFSIADRGLYLSVGNEPIKFNVTSSILSLEDMSSEFEEEDAIKPRFWSK